MAIGREGERGGGGVGVRAWPLSQTPARWKKRKEGGKGKYERNK